MGSFSRSLFARPEPEPAQEEVASTEPVAGLDSLFGEVPDMDPVWAEGSEFFHTKARCTRFKAIDKKNLRRQKTEPAGKTLCDICKKITQLGRKG
jgi:hypothetical protein